MGKIEVSKPARRVEEIGINFTVLLDEDFHVGGRFNSSEMPTTEIRSYIHGENLEVRYNSAGAGSSGNIIRAICQGPPGGVYGLGR